MSSCLNSLQCCLQHRASFQDLLLRGLPVPSCLVELLALLLRDALKLSKLLLMARYLFRVGRLS